jgi:hypothetical protein
MRYAFLISVIVVALSTASAQILPEIDPLPSGMTVERLESHEPWKSPRSFRGVDFGSNESTASKVLGQLKCQGQKIGETGARICTPSEKNRLMKIDDVIVRDTYCFVEDKLVRVVINPLRYNDPTLAEPNPQLDSVLAAFRERYGTPTLILRKETPQNGRWSTFQWMDDKLRVTILGDGLGGFADAEIVTAEWLRNFRPARSTTPF